MISVAQFRSFASASAIGSRREMPSSPVAGSRMTTPSGLPLLAALHGATGEDRGTTMVKWQRLASSGSSPTSGESKTPRRTLSLLWSSSMSSSRQRRLSLTRAGTLPPMRFARSASRASSLRCSWPQPRAKNLKRPALVSRST